MLKFCSECPGVFVPDSEINDEDDADLPLIQFHHYVNIGHFSLHKELLPEHGKKCPSLINIENSEKGKVTTGKSFVLK